MSPKKITAEFAAAKIHSILSTDEVVRMLREFKDWPPEILARRSGISVKDINLIEHGQEIGKHKAAHIAKALNVHPALIMFPEYEPPGAWGQ